MYASVRASPNHHCVFVDNAQTLVILALIRLLIARLCDIGIMNSAHQFVRRACVPARALHTHSEHCDCCGFHSTRARGSLNRSGDKKHK